MSSFEQGSHIPLFFLKEVADDFADGAGDGIGDAPLNAGADGFGNKVGGTVGFTGLCAALLFGGLFGLGDLFGFGGFLGRLFAYCGNFFGCGFAVGGFVIFATERAVVDDFLAGAFRYGAHTALWR